MRARQQKHREEPELRLYRRRGHRSRNPRLAKALERNMRTLAQIRRESAEARSVQDRIADLITRCSGSMGFVYFHVAWFGLWIVANTGALRLRPFDPYPYGLLTMLVSLEAIFLSTFVLISQNRMASIAEDRADLGLQITILDEHEVTRILRLVDAMAAKMGVEIEADPELAELEEDVPTDLLLRQIGESKRR